MQCGNILLVILSLLDISYVALHTSHVSMKRSNIPSIQQSSLGIDLLNAIQIYNSLVFPAPLGIYQQTNAIKQSYEYQKCGNSSVCPSSLCKCDLIHTFGKLTEATSVTNFQVFPVLFNCLKNSYKRCINVSLVIKALTITDIFKDAKQPLMKGNTVSVNKVIKP